MKRIAKNLLPDRALRRASRIRRAGRRTRSIRRTARVTTFPDGDGPVLQACVAYNDLGGYCVPLASRDRPAAQRILAGQVWEHDTIRFLAASDPGGDLVHAGTYFGDFLPALSRSREPGAKVWAFEPNPESYRCAQVTALINGIENVALANAGLGPRRCRLAMETHGLDGRALGGASRIVTGADGDADATLEVVEILAVDEAIPADRRVAAIQLDVEGFEQHALAGALATIRRCRPLLVLETLPEEPWFAEHVLSLGYRVAEKLDANWVIRPS